MNTNPNPPSMRPSFGDKISPDTTLIPDDIVIHEGKKYKVEKQIIQHGTTWKVWQGTEAIFLAIFSFGIGLAFQVWRDAIKNKWHQAMTGQETSFIYTRLRKFPPEIETTTKTSQLGANLQPIKESPNTEPTITESLKEPLTKLPITVRNFLDEARKDVMFTFTIADLEKGLEEALNVAENITHPDDKTTILTISGLLAEHYVVSNFDKAIKLRIRTAQAISPTPPLSKLPDAIKTEDPKLGLRLQPLDTSLFKNQTLVIQKRKYTHDKPRLHINAKINHPAREHLKSTLEQIVADPNKLFNALPKGFCSSISTYDSNLSYEGRHDAMGKKWAGDFSANVASQGYVLPNISPIIKVIDFEGVGTVHICTDPNCRTAYNNISIELNSNISEAEAVEKLNMIFAIIGLGAVSSSPREEDIERIKIMQLFRAYYPQISYHFERKALAFDYNLETLKTLIIQDAPEMKDKFKEFLIDHPERMYQQEVYPGQSIWAIQGLAKEVKDAGGLGLMAGVFGNDFDDSARRFASILKVGSLATQDRFQAGIIAAGASVQEDINSGGAESVFTRLVTDNMAKNPNSYSLNGKMQILYDLALVERVGFVYPSDYYGTKEESLYQYRTSVVELANDCQNDPHFNQSNEVCIRSRVPPKYIKGVMVANEGEKNALIATLKLEGLMTTDTLNREYINGVPIDQFIHVGEFKKEYWD